MKRISVSISLIAMLLACLFTVPAYAQNGTSTPNWNFNCADGQYVEVIGSGTQVPGSPPTLLSIPNIATIDSIVTEVVFKGAPSNIPISATIMSNVAQTVTNSNQIILPNFGSTEVAGVFRTTMNPANQLMASVSPASAGSYTWAFIAYVYRSGSGRSSSGVYSSAVVLNNSYSITLPIAVTSGPKNIKVESILSELNADTTRIVLVNATAGGVTVLDSVEFPNLGTSLNLTAYTLFNVPGSTTSLTLTYDSPIILPGGITGDSFIPGANVTVESCPCNITVNVDSTSNALCKNSTDGSINISVIGGTPPLTYAWSNSATTEDLTNVGAGVYSVTVFDATQCSASATSIVITEPSAVNASIINSTNVTINGAANGTATASGSGGTSPYTYLWSNTQTTAMATNLSAGPYTVTVSDVNGCSDMDNIEISQPDSLTITTSHTNVICGGDSTGTATVDTVIGGVSPYTYLWSNNETTQTITGLPIGNYIVTVTDAIGAVAMGAEQVTGPQNPLTATSVDINENCFGGLNGSIDLMPSGGTPLYSYQWSNGATTQDLIAIGGGTYTVTITDANNCTFVYTTTLTEPDSFYVTETHVNIACHGESTGSIDLSVFGGTQPYGIFWSNGTSTEDLSNLSAGPYTVIVTDASNSTGCTAQLSIIITEPNPIVVNIESGNILCFGDTTASAAAFGSGGTGIISYLWSTGETTQNISGLGAGTYIVYATDSLGCTATDTITIAQPQSAVSVNIIGSTNVSTNAGSDGTATAVASGGTAPLSLLWSNGETGNTADSLSAGTYIVTVTDDNGCTDTDTVIITQPDTISITTISSNVFCFGDSNGVASVTNITGGVGPYDYLWSNGDTTQTITGLVAGTYTVIVTDANGSSATGVEVITQPQSAVTCNIDSIIHVSCNGLSDGSFIVNASGGPSNGAGPYDVEISTTPGGGGSSNSTNLPAGTYYVTVTDISNAASCSASCQVTITEPPVLGCSIVRTHITCYGGSDGSITVTASGGTSPYSYLWNDNDTNAVRTNLSLGTYTVTITDANGCSIVKSRKITQPKRLRASKVVTKVSCFGGNDGAIDLTVIGGTSPFTFQWIDGSTDEDRTGLTKGVYTVTITDANNCTKVIMPRVKSYKKITSTRIITDASCAGNDGAIDLTVKGGKAPYAYEWSNSATTQDIIGIPGGTYVVTVTDANNCTYTRSIDVGTTASMTCTVSISNHVSCFGDNDGLALAIVNGGTPPYSYAWSNNQTTTLASGLTAGIYTVTVTDGSGNTSCTTTCQDTIIEPPLLECSVDSTVVTCYGGSDGTATVSAIGGIGSYTYLWSNNQTTQTATGLSAGTYTVIVFDQNGITSVCSDTCTITITQNPELTCSVDSTVVTCYGGSDGTATVTASGGTPPYTYLWDDLAAQTTQTATGLSAGTYTVIVFDQNGITSACSDTCTITITQNPELTCSVDSTVVTCYGGSDGTATVTASGGTPPYTYLWDDLAAQTTQTATGLSAGTYTVIVFDQNGITSACSDTCTITITQNPELTCSVDSTVVTCYGGSDGTATVTASGGTPPYTYLWDDPAAQTTQTATGLSAGTYTVIVFDQNGITSACSDTCTITITQNPELTCSVDSTVVTCYGGSDGTATVTASGGTPPYTYLWDDPAAQTTQTATGLSAGTYTVIVFDQNGITSACSDTCTITITQNPELTCSVDSTVVTCYGGSDGTATVTASGGTPPYTYLWDDPAAQTTQTATGLSAGTYTVIVFDQNGITSACSDTCEITIYQPDSLYCTIESTDATCVSDSNGTATVHPKGGTGPYTYVWSHSAILNDSIATGLSAGTYTVIVFDQNGISSACSDTCEVYIAIDSIEISCTFTNLSNCTPPPPPPPPVVTPCTTCDCDGKIIQMTVIYDGPAGASVNVGPSSSSNPTSWTNVQPGDTLTANLGNIGNDWYWIVNGVQDANIHASCSDDILNNVNSTKSDFGHLGSYPNPDQNSTDGTFLVIGHIDDKGNVCGDAGNAVPAPCPCLCSGKIIEMTVIYDGPNGTNVNVGASSSNNPTSWSNVQNGDTLTANLGNIGNDWYWIVNGVQDANIHASCSDDIFNNVNSTKSDFGSLGNYPNPHMNNNNGTFLVIGHKDDNNNVCQNPAPPAPPAPPTSLPCDGTISCTVTGGSGQYSYTWTSTNSTTPVSSINAPNLDSLCAGVYCVVVTDLVSGCMDSVCITIDTADVLTCVASGDTVQCGASTGTVSVSPNGGVMPYTYLWNTGDSTAVVNNLGPGVYEVLVTDAKGCTTVCQATIIDIAPVVTICPDQEVGFMPPSCDCDGKIIEMVVIYDGPAGASVNVGPSSSSNTTSWSNVQPGDTLIANLGNIGNDWYWIVNGVQDANIHASCSDDILNNVNSTKSDYGSLGNYPNPHMNNNNGTFLVIGHTDDKGNVCPAGGVGGILGGATANINIDNVSGGIAPYTYVWSNGSTDMNLLVSLGSSTTYTVTVTDATGCSATAEHTVTVIDITVPGNPDKVIMCHDPYTSPHTHDIDKKDIAKKLSEGWTLGPCGYDFSQPNACGSYMQFCGCEGGIQAMGVIYNGAAGATVAFYDGSVSASNLVQSYTNVMPGDSLFFTGNGNKFSSGSNFTINGGAAIEIHLSCSQPVQGETFGGVLYVYGTIDDAGNCCNLDCPPSPPAPCACSGKIVEMCVVYDGPAGATLTVGPNATGINPYSWSNAQPGDTLLASLGNVGNNWYWAVNGTVDADIHTSCSDDILGNVYSSKSDFGHLGSYPNPEQNSNDGTFLVIGHVDENGNICTIGQVVPRGFTTSSIAQHLMQLNVYPNPTTGQLNVSFVAEDRDKYKLELMDMTGRVVFVEADATHSGVNFLTYDFNSLPKGVYILQLDMNSQVERLRVIID